jgi:poly(3-hydroxybutyrate) depolymerase
MPRVVVAGWLLVALARVAVASADAPPGAAPLPAGAARIALPLDDDVGPAPAAGRSPAAPETLTVFTYRPPGYRDGPLIIVMHGSSRDADVYRDRARVLGDRFGALIVAPHFDRRRFPAWRYPGANLIRGGRVRPADERTFALIGRLVATIRRREGRRALPCYLIGHSAGARFLLLLAAFSELPAERIVAANPSAPLWPTRALRFPRGFAGLPAALADDQVRRRYLARPLTLYLGEADATQDHNARARFAAAGAEAARLGWSFGWRLVTVPRVGHRSEEMFRRPEVAEALFGRPAAP